MNKVSLTTKKFMMTLLLLTLRSAKADVSGDQLERVSLSAPFTLVYEMTDHDVSSQAERNEAAGSVRRGYEWMVAHGSMTRQQADWNIAHVLPAMREPRPNRVYTVTLSSGVGKLFCRRQSRPSPDSAQSPDSAAGVRNALLIYDGKQSFTIMNDQGETIPGFQIIGVAPCPLPGAGIPYIPAIKNPVFVRSAAGIQTFSGDVPCLNGDTAMGGKTPRLLFQPGEVSLTSAGGRVRVVEIKTQAGDQVSTRWQFTSHKLFHNHWIASDMAWTSYRGGLPQNICDFHLQSMSTDPLPVEQFDGPYWMKPMADLIVRQGPQSVVFGSGSIESDWVRRTYAHPNSALRPLRQRQSLQ